MLSTGNLNTPLQSGSVLSSATRVRMANLDIVLAVAEAGADLSAHSAQTPIMAKVLAVSPEAAAGQTQRIQVEIDGKALWVSMLKQPPTGSQVLLRFTDQASLEAAAQIGQGTATTPDSATASPASQSGVKFSPFGNLINQLLSRISAAPQQPAQLPALWSDPAAVTQGGRAQHANGADAARFPVEQIASGMHRAVEKSGLFYESHLEAWVRNERPLEQLRQEPQAQLPLAAAGDPPAPLPDKLLPIMREQMHVLEQRQFTAQVEVWPQQTAQLTIADDRQADDAEDTVNPSWRAQMKLHLPRLGAIDATLRIQGQNVHLDLLAQEDSSATSLRSQISQLQKALQDSGLQLTQFKIQPLPPPALPLKARGPMEPA